MGTWGTGNFENDGALDYVGRLVGDLTNTITRCFDTDNASLDEDGESELMPSVAIIAILSERCGAAPPKPEVVESWRSKYLAIYDEQIDELEPDPDYKVERRKTIDATFAELTQLAIQCWKR